MPKYEGPRPVNRKALARRFDVRGKEVEQVELNVSTHGHRDRVYLQIEGEKRTQNFSMARENWDNLVPLLRKPLGRQYAVCSEHAGDALFEMSGYNVRIHRFEQPDESFHCHCKRPAEFLLFELSGTYES